MLLAFHGSILLMWISLVKMIDLNTGMPPLVIELRVPPEIEWTVVVYG